MLGRDGRIEEVAGDDRIDPAVLPGEVGPAVQPDREGIATEAAGHHAASIGALVPGDGPRRIPIPDVRHQLLEVKLQTSPTIDLGLVTPESTEPLDVPMLDGVQVRHCDVRYAIFYAKIEGGNVTLTHLLVSSGADFFKRFPQFQGKVLNAKLQIPLPAKFFAQTEGLPD